MNSFRSLVYREGWPNATGGGTAAQRLSTRRFHGQWAVRAARRSFPSLRIDGLLGLRVGPEVIRCQKPGDHDPALYQVFLIT
jgi:hypothetical protein